MGGSYDQYCNYFSHCRSADSRREIFNGAWSGKLSARKAVD